MNDIVNIYEPEWNLIWTNPDITTEVGGTPPGIIPTTSFSAQTIQLDLSNYDEIKIEYFYHYYVPTSSSYDDDAYSSMYEDINVGGLGYLMCWGKSYVGSNGTTNGKDPNLFLRNVCVTSNEITFSTCYVKKTSDTTVATTQNTTVIPCRIWAR